MEGSFDLKKVTQRELNKGYHTLKIGTLGNFNPMEGDNCKVAGWGLSEYMDDFKYPENLKAVSVPIRNTKQCEKDYRRLSKNRKGGTSDLKSF